MPFDNRTFPVTTPVAQALGASELTPEQSRNYSVGLALNPVKNLSVTADYYQILIDDRIVFTGNFTGAAVRTFLESQGFPGVAGGRFFTNAIDTRTLGVDVVANYGFAIGTTSTLRLTGGYNYNVNRVLRIAPTPAALSAFQETLFDRVERARIEVGQPKSNLYLSGVFNYQDLGFTVRTQRFGEVTSFGTPTDGSLDQTFSAKWITDVNASYTFAGRFTLTAGVDNVFDVYPDENSRETPPRRGTITSASSPQPDLPVRFQWGVLLWEADVWVLTRKQRKRRTVNGKQVSINIPVYRLPSCSFLLQNPGCS